MVSDQNTSVMSLPGTPLKAIDNICSSLVADDVSVSGTHGPTFVHPRLSGTPAVRRTVVAEEHVAVRDVMSLSAAGCAVLRRDDKPTAGGCSQDGGFLLESQAVQRSVIDLTVDEVSESQFRPAAVSTQISTRNHVLNLLPTISTFENGFASKSLVSGMRESDSGKVVGADSETVSVTAEVCLNAEDNTASKSCDSGVSQSSSPELFDGDREVSEMIEASQGQLGNKAAACYANSADCTSLSYSTVAQKLASRKLKARDSSSVEKSETSMVTVTCEAADSRYVKQTGTTASTHSRMSLRSSKRRQRGVDFLDEIDKVTVILPVLHVTCGMSLYFAVPVHMSRLLTV